MHFSDARESIHISDSTCKSQGDDGLNVHATYFIVTEIINTTTLIIQEFNWTDSIYVGEGVQLEFSSHQQPFTSHSIGTVASSTFYSTSSQLFIFTSPINVSVGDFAFVNDKKFDCRK
jgi:hypothetical protein